MSKPQVRNVETAFSGLGIVGIPGQIWRIEAGVTAPPALLVNSLPYEGAIPHDAITYDAEQADRYRRRNTPRPEPVPEPLLTEEEILQQRRWTAAKFSEAKKAGFPSPSAMRDVFDADGIPIGRTNLWHRRVVDDWFDRLTGLAGGR